MDEMPSIKLNHLYKTELCRNWEELGACRYGKKCRYAHGIEEMRVVPKHTRYKTQICRAYHIDGTCPYGSRCTFIHDDESLTPLSAATTGSSSDSDARTVPSPPLTAITNTSRSALVPFSHVVAPAPASMGSSPAPRATMGLVPCFESRFFVNEKKKEPVWHSKLGLRIDTQPIQPPRNAMVPSDAQLSFAMDQCVPGQLPSGATASAAAPPAASSSTSSSSPDQALFGYTLMDSMDLTLDDQYCPVSPWNH